MAKKIHAEDQKNKGFITLSDEQLGAVSGGVDDPEKEKNSDLRDEALKALTIISDDGRNTSGQVPDELDWDMNPDASAVVKTNEEPETWEHSRPGEEPWKTGLQDPPWDVPTQLDSDPTQQWESSPTHRDPGIDHIHHINPDDISSMDNTGIWYYDHLAGSQSDN